MKVYEIGFRTGDNPDESDDCVVWIATDRKISLTSESDARYIREIDVDKFYPAGVDIIVK